MALGPSERKYLEAVESCPKCKAEWDKWAEGIRKEFNIKDKTIKQQRFEARVRRNSLPPWAKRRRKK